MLQDNVGKLTEFVKCTCKNNSKLKIQKAVESLAVEPQTIKDKRKAQCFIFYKNSNTFTTHKSNFTFEQT